MGTEPEMVARAGAFDWAATPLGPAARWPQSLRTAVDLMLAARQPVLVAWGPELTALYNDHYIRLLGPAHPAALGQPCRVLFGETWGELRPIVDAVLAGEARDLRDRRAPPVGLLSISWTPLRDDGGSVAGFYCVVTVEEALRRDVADRETLLREINHRVKNNLELIDSLIGLQASAIPDPRVRAMLEETSNRIHAIAEIHRLLDLSEDFATVEMRAFTEQLSRTLRQAFTADPARARIVIDAQELYLDLRRAVPLGLILNELVSNALEHAFPGEPEGTLTIGLRVDGPEIEVRVADDGVGLPPVRPEGTLGLRLVEVLTEQLRGRLVLAPAGGCVVTIRFRAQP